MTQIRAVLFDVFGTVVDWRSGVAREADAFFAKHGIENVDAFAFADAWRDRYGPSMAVISSGRRGFVRLDVLHRENLEAALKQFGIDPAKLPEAALADLNLAWHRLDPWPDAIAGLTRLRTKYLIAPLSNGNIILLTNMAKRAGIPWDAILGAEIVRAYKPTPESYLRTVDVLGMKPEEVCLVAAHNGDLEAGQKCGLRTGMVPRPTEHGPGQTIDLAPTGNWDFVAKDFVALAAAMGC
jgi:2-haloacid dehalogenase